MSLTGSNSHALSTLQQTLTTTCNEGYRGVPYRMRGKPAGIMAKSRKKSFAITIFPLCLSLLTFVGFGYYMVFYSKGSERSYGEKYAGTVETFAISATNGEKDVAKLSTKIIYPVTLDDPAKGAYPLYSSLLDVVSTWNPDNPEPPSVFKETLQHFNFSNPDEMRMAVRFRNAELPFKVYGVPEVDAASTKWDDAYLTKEFSSNIQSRRVEKSKNNHFMYWNPNVRSRMRSYWEPPTEVLESMQFENWVRIARRADEAKVKNESVHYYFMSNTPQGSAESSFISRDLPSFSDASDNFFVSNSVANKGIQCRFGMRGIIAEAHYDAGRNMVAMIKGAKRYILNPPRECKQLGLIIDKENPSYRHSAIDWSDISQATARGFGKIDAIDTIVQSGEVLYIPSYWFHYIVSLKYSIQCNSRSGSPPNGEGQTEIEACLGEKLSLGR